VSLNTRIYDATWLGGEGNVKIIGISCIWPMCIMCHLAMLLVCTMQPSFHLIFLIS